MRLDKRFINEEEGGSYGILYFTIMYVLFPQYFDLPAAHPNSGPPYPEGTVPPNILNILDYNGDGQVNFEDMLIALSLHGYGESEPGGQPYDLKEQLPPEYLEGLPKGAKIIGVPAYWYRYMNGIPPYEFPNDLQRRKPMSKDKLLNQLQSDAKIKIDSKVSTPKSPEMLKKFVDKFRGAKSSSTPPTPPSGGDVKSIPPQLGGM